MDVNRDGRPDVVSSGWMRIKGAFRYENPGPEGLRAGEKWKATRFHAARNMEGVIHGDLDGDGDQDILCNHWAPVEGQGMTWLEQKLDGARRAFETHWIETDYGQFHTMAMGDLNGDDRPDLVTGKRLFAHHGRDTSCYEPLFAFWYDIGGGRFERHLLAFNHLPKLEDDETARNPAPSFVPAVGMKLNIADMDADGDNDVVICGKGGALHLLQQGHGRPVWYRNIRIKRLD